MVSATASTGREELAGILARAARQDGPVRLLTGRRPQQTGDTGLFPTSRGRHGRLLEQMLGTFLREVPGRPRMVVLTRSGVERLIKNTPQNDRPELVEQSSPLYQAALLKAWKKVATRGEEKVFADTVKKLYGTLLMDETGDASIQDEAGRRDDLNEFRELLAQEVAESWKESASDEAKQRLGHILKLLGAEAFGAPGEVISFTGLQHVPLDPLFKGDPARMVQPGWVFPKSPTPLLLIKAEVASPSLSRLDSSSSQRSEF